MRGVPSLAYHVAPQCPDPARGSRRLTMRRDDPILSWADVSGADLIIVTDDDDDPTQALAGVTDRSATSPASAWDHRDPPPARLWTDANVRALYTSTLQTLARQLAARRQRRTPRPD